MASVQHLPAGSVAANLEAVVPEVLGSELEDAPGPLGSHADWRCGRLLLVRSPNRALIAPGAALTVTGALVSLIVLARVGLVGRAWGLHVLIGGSLLTVLGIHLLSVGLCAQAYATHFLGRRDRWFERLRAHVRLEHGLIVGFASAATGLLTVAYIMIDWISSGFGSLGQERVAVVAATLVVLGTEIVFCSFLLNILGLRAGSPDLQDGNVSLSDPSTSVSI
jgi:hypothetical protein